MKRNLTRGFVDIAVRIKEAASNDERILLAKKKHLPAVKINTKASDTGREEGKAASILILLGKTQFNYVKLVLFLHFSKKKLNIAD